MSIHIHELHCLFFFWVSLRPWGFLPNLLFPRSPQAPGESAAFAGGVFFWSRKTAGGKFRITAWRFPPHSWLTLAPREPVQHNTAIDSEKADGFGVKKSLAQWVFTTLVKKQRCKFRKVSDGGCWSSIQAIKKNRIDWVIFERKFTNLDTVCLKID